METLARFASPLLFVIALAAPASAQDAALPSAAVLETQTGEGVQEGTEGAVDRMIRARLDGLDVVRTSSGVALDLSEVQLALGCVGETPECLTPVANELSVQLLLIPALDQTDGELMLTITVFDREAGTLRRAVRQASGENARAELLDAIDGQLRELFGLPAAPPEITEPEEPTPVQPPPDELSPGPFIVMGAGVAVLAVGIGLGVAHLDAQSEFEGLVPQTEAEVHAANDVFSRAESLGIAASVLMPLGAALAAAGVVWLVIDLTDGASGDAVTLTPLVSPSFAGLAIDGRWGMQ